MYVERSWRRNPSFVFGSGGAGGGHANDRDRERERERVEEGGVSSELYERLHVHVCVFLHTRVLEYLKKKKKKKRLRKRLRVRV